MTNDKNSPAYRAYVLFMLVIVYTFNFIDRQIIGILAIPIKADLGLTDTQLGLMGGLAFAVFYTTLAIPIALIADKKNRIWIITIALFSWSCMTALCGLAQNFWQLFLARIGVGVGEAGGVAPSYSLIADYFPVKQRARALSVYSFGIPIGGAVGIVFGGIIATYIDWRYAFIFVGIAGIILTPIFKATVKEPVRGVFDSPQPDKTTSLKLILKLLSKKPSFWALSFAASCSSMMGYGLFFWLPSFFVRSYNISLLDASLVFGGILLIGGIIGIWLGGFLVDKFGLSNKSLHAIIPAIALIITIPFFLFGVLSSTLYISATVLIIPTALGMVWLGPVISAIQHLVKPHMRATASAIFLLINNLIGIGIGTLIIGYLSDVLTVHYGNDALRYAILSGTVFYVAAAIIFFIAAKYLKQDWED